MAKTPKTVDKPKVSRRKSNFKSIPKDPKVARGNLAKHSNTYWTINIIMNNRHPDDVGMSYEEASKRIVSAKEKLGPHRKVLKRLDNLQHQLIFGVNSKCRPKAKSKRNSQATISYLIPRT